MYENTAGNAVTYEAKKKPEETSKSGRKRVLFSDKTNDKDRLCSDYSKRSRDDGSRKSQVCRSVYYCTPEFCDVQIQRH